MLRLMMSLTMSLAVCVLLAGTAAADPRELRVVGLSAAAGGAACTADAVTAEPAALASLIRALAHEPKQFVRVPAGGHDDLVNFGMIEIARRFINGS